MHYLFIMILGGLLVLIDFDNTMSSTPSITSFTQPDQQSGYEGNSNFEIDSIHPENKDQSNGMVQRFMLIDRHRIWNMAEFGTNGSQIAYRKRFDTTLHELDGKEYYNVLRSFSQDENEWEPTDLFLSEEGNKVFQYDAFRNTSILVLDYDLNTGDEFENVSFGIKNQVEKVDTITLADGQNYKQIHFECGYVWIEGWGNRYTGLDALHEFCLTDIPEFFLCGYYEDQLVLQNIDSCWYDIVIETTETFDSKPIIFPNPAADEILIKNGPDGSLRYLIVDQVGRIVQEGKTESKIDVSSLVNGLYVISLQMKGEEIKQRFIKVGN